LWFGYWNLARRYHRYRVQGMEHLGSPGPLLLVGYHGRPIAHDLCMLMALLEERGGRSFHPIIHGAFDAHPWLRAFIDGVGFLRGDERELAEAFARGARVVVTPGGTLEGCRSHRERYRVAWGGRLGYLKLAIRHGVPIVPCAAAGVDDAYVGLNDGHAWGRRLGVPLGLPLWLGVGPLGLWPLSPPWPVPMTTFLGPSLHSHLGADPADRQGLLALDADVREAVQGLLDRARRGGRR
jgi:1-acyl-sn-glycerol-3-phosphate acyltransferase